MGGGASVQAGRRVLVNGKHEGTVKWTGTVNFDKGKWVGVELVKPVGNTDGTVKGTKYFVCKPNHGVLVRASQVQPYDEATKAATTIETAMRGRLAKKQVARRMYNTLDNQEEHANLDRRAQMGGILMMAPPSSNIGDSEIDSIVVEPEYEGAHITWPLTEQCVMDLLTAFKARKLLHAKYVMQILTQYQKFASALPTIVRVRIPEGARFTIVGDTHGQLSDVLHIFNINGVPAEFNEYLFNGDFVDRGENGVEIAMLLYSFQLLYPEYVFVNRGNHECRSQTQVQGFMVEVLDKYNPGGNLHGTAIGSIGQARNRGNQIFEKFLKCFDALPLATVVQDNVFVVHGGLFERKGVRIAHLEGINRQREIPLTRTTFEDGLFQDMMWSDPQDERGVRPSTRGAGQFFGKDVTQGFCQANGLHLVIRSHECVPDGFEFTHGSQLLTIFSASDYCGDTGNLGAFVVFKSDMKANIEQFMASEGTETGPSRLAKTHKAVLAKLVDLICAAKHDLFWYFANLDRRHLGTVSRVEWADALRTVLKLDLPFMRLCGDLTTVDEDGRINYAKFLERYKIALPDEIANGWQDKIIQLVYEKLLVAVTDVDEAYRFFDVNEDGTVEYQEFVNALKRLDLGLSDAQLFDLMGYIDEDKNSHIDFEEFRKRFQIVLSQTEGRAWPAEDSEDWVGSVLSAVGSRLFGLGHKSVVKVFSEMDTNGDGSLSYSEFTTALTQICEEKEPKFSLTEEQVLKIARAVDSDSSGKINYKEFLAAFRVTDKGRRVDHLRPSSPSSGGAEGGDASGMSTPASPVKPMLGAGAAAGSSRNVTGTAQGTGTVQRVASSGATLLRAGSQFPSLKRVGTEDGRGATWDQAAMDELITTLYTFRVELAASFRLFDADNSGKVSRDEFARGLEILKLPFGRPITMDQIDCLMHMLDKNGDGQLDYDEFFNGFSVLNTETGVAARQSYRQRA